MSRPPHPRIFVGHLGILLPGSEIRTESPVPAEYEVGYWDRSSFEPRVDLLYVLNRQRAGGFL